VTVLDRARRRRVVVAAVIVVLTVVLLADSSAGAAGSPIDPANRPTPLAGQVNGEVDAARLVAVAPSCVAVREAGPSLYRVFAMARASRVGLAAEECYRPLSDQLRYAREAQQPGNNPACVASVGTSPAGKPVGRSFHGWGKAVDLTNGARSLRFTDPGYAFMKRVAGSLGWNHPRFAEPGGSSCPEPWHWEWVGDGGALGRDPVRADAVGLLPGPGGAGYGVVTGLGAVEARDGFVARGGVDGLRINWVVVGGAPVPSTGGGYWLAGADGGVFALGGARFYGSTGGMRLSQPVLGMEATRSGRGYWLVAWDGGVFSFGDARFFGSTGAMTLNAPVVGVARTRSGRGYWLVASDGGVFAFGDARFRGSTGGVPLRAPVVGMARSASGDGYWLVSSDGGVFAFGDARFRGSLGWVPLTSPVVAIAAVPGGDGYRLLQADGTVTTF
jgi:hypothetical protein